jgi:hypothetical protein
MSVTLVDRTDEDGNRIKVTASPEIMERLGRPMAEAFERAVAGKRKPPAQIEAFTREETGEAVAGQ